MASVVVSKALGCFSFRKSKLDGCFSVRKSELDLHVPRRSAADGPAVLPGTATCSSASSASCSSSSSRERTMLREVFQYLDQDRDGRISSNELRDSFASIGEEMPPAAAEVAIDDLDSDGDRLVDFEDFVRLMEKGREEGQKEEEEEEEEEELRKVFGMFEVVKGSGRITPMGLQKMLGRLGDDKSIEECKVMIDAYDLDGDGELDFHEFHLMMN